MYNKSIVQANCPNWKKEKKKRTRGEKSIILKKHKDSLKK